MEQLLADNVLIKVKSKTIWNKATDYRSSGFYMATLMKMIYLEETNPETIQHCQ